MPNHLFLRDQIKDAQLCCAPQQFVSFFILCKTLNALSIPEKKALNVATIRIHHYDSGNKFTISELLVWFCHM